MWAWHITTPINALFGVVVYVYAHIARFNANGVACAEVQPARAKLLVAQIIFFYVIYILAAVFMATFPKVAWELAINGWNSREAERKEEEAQKRKEAKEARARDREVMGLAPEADSE